MSNAPTANLVCPKCRGAMASYERSGVVVDQCQDCRGIFLDRGELEQLTDKESAYFSKESDRNYRDDDDDYKRRDNAPYEERYGYKRRKKNSFLGELFGDD